jgi:hypothetical protein
VRDGVTARDRRGLRTATAHPVRRGARIRLDL